MLCKVYGKIELVYLEVTFLDKNRHKRKKTKCVLVVSDSTTMSVVHKDGNRFFFWGLAGSILVLVLALGLTYLQKDFLYLLVLNEEAALQREIEELEEQNATLNSELKNLNSNLTAMSDALTLAGDVEKQLRDSLDDYLIPADLPLNKAASILESAGAEPSFTFNATIGSFVIATATGIITSIEESEDGLMIVTIDHGNQYKSVYHNQGSVQFKVNDKVMKGMTLFIIDEDNTNLVYQVIYEDEYINPADMLTISG